MWSIPHLAQGRPNDDLFKLKLLGDPEKPEEDGPRVAFNVEAKLPTGEQLTQAGTESFFGDQSVGIAGLILADYKTGKINFSANAGFRFRPDTTQVIENITIGKELPFGAGLSYSVSDTLLVGGEVDAIAQIEGDSLVIRHPYIERRMIPLNIYLQDATPEQMEHAVVEYGNAIKDLVAANIFPGDMLWKNFGVTRHGKVVFYVYDEIEYLTDCHFRKVPEPRNEEEELSGEVWYPVGPRDVFPETFGPFLLGNPQVREVFMRHHADLLDPAYWESHKERIRAGHVHDVFPYERGKRFRSFLIGGLVGSAAGLAAGGRLRVARRPARRETPVGLAAFEQAPCYAEVLERESREERRQH